MDAYDLGSMNDDELVDLGYTPGEFRSPAAVQQLAEEIRTQIDSLNRDIQTSDATREGDFRNRWHDFVSNFFEFYKYLADSMWSKIQTVNIDRLLDYRDNKIPAWELALRKAGGKVSGPGSAPPPKDSGFSIPTWVIVIGGVVAAGFVLSQVTGVVRAFKSQS